MASLIEELVGTLSREQELYQKLLPLAEEKTRVIVRNDLERLQEITSQEQEFVDEITSLEHKRKSNVANIAIVMSRKAEELNISVIAEMLKTQPEQHDELCRLHDGLTKLLKRLKEINEQNQALIEQSLEMIQFNMNVLQSDRVAPVNNYTSRAATMDIPMSQHGSFDTKQ